MKEKFQTEIRELRMMTQDMNALLDSANDENVMEVLMQFLDIMRVFEKQLYKLQAEESWGKDGK